MLYQGAEKSWHRRGHDYVEVPFNTGALALETLGHDERTVPLKAGKPDTREEACVSIADMIDMRMPFTFWHSRAVANIADAAGECMGFPDADLRAMRWAGYTHDIGELAVPVSTWMKTTPISIRDVDSAHLHPYHGERALAALGGDGQPVAALILRHHERLDGSGYHRYAKAPDLSPSARILAAAEASQTARERRPHRKALSDGAAAAQVRYLQSFQP